MTVPSLRRYPEEAPLVEVEESGDNVDEEVLAQFMGFVKEQASLASPDAAALCR